MRMWIGAIFALSGGVLLLAGCGSKGTTTSTTSTVDWAGGVCSAVTTWQSSVSSAIDSVTNGNISKSSIQQAAHEVDSATKTFTDTVKGLGKPNTKAGAQAQQSLDQLSSEIAQERQKIDDAIGKATTLSEIVTQAPVILDSLRAMRSDVSTTFKQLQTLDASGELASAFKQSSACKSLVKPG
jgi:hypothetical protein